VRSFRAAPRPPRPFPALGRPSNVARLRRWATKESTASSSRAQATAARARDSKSADQPKPKKTAAPRKAAATKAATSPSSKLLGVLESQRRAAGRCARHLRRGALRAPANAALLARSVRRAPSPDERRGARRRHHGRGKPARVRRAKGRFMRHEPTFERFLEAVRGTTRSAATAPRMSRAARRPSRRSTRTRSRPAPEQQEVRLVHVNVTELRVAATCPRLRWFDARATAARPDGRMEPRILTSASSAGNC
jgi:hypothetical protein